jgi:hypothetical protein
MSDMANEYNALRAEILTWIQVEYTLIGLTAASVSAALGFFKDDTGGSWPYFSSALLFVLTCLGCLTAFARAKIMITSAYIIVFHSRETDWEGRMSSIEYDGNRRFRRKGLFTLVHKVSLTVLYSVLAIGSVYYPYSIQKPGEAAIGSYSMALLVLSISAFVFMLVIFFMSYNRKVFVAAWKELKTAEAGRPLKGQKPREPDDL